HGWLNDRAYAEAVAHAVTRSKPASSRMLKAKLQARHIADEAIGDVLSTAASRNHELAGALDLARRKLDTDGGPSPRPRLWRRIAALLARRGYDEDAVETVRQRLQFTDEGLGQ